MHYTAAQHVLDADLDPASSSGQNPFVPNLSYNGADQYMVPISLGSITTTPTQGCAISPFEEDNLLDATQWHLSVNWNTVVQGPAPPATVHAVDSASHTNPNMAGDIIIRDYLAPPANCPSGPGSCTMAPVQPAYLFVRDVTTGCPYTLTHLQSNLLYTGPTGGVPAGTAVVGIRDPSTVSSNWLSKDQEGAHLQYTQVNPQACYANGDAHLPVGQQSPKANEVAWARSPEWEGRPGPDDSYVGALVSSGDLGNLSNGSTCLHSPNNSGTCVLRMRFQLPAMPTIPCRDINGNDTCALSGNEQLRYWSVSFLQQQQSASNNLVLDPDGIGAPTSTPTETIVSLADAAFCTTTPCYVTLIVGVGTNLSAAAPWLVTNTNPSPKGVVPVAITNSSGSFYTVVQGVANSSNAGYTVLDFSPFIGSSCPSGSPCFSTGYPLELVIRNTLPNTQSTAQPAPFYCSGLAVPFSTADYTNSDGAGGGFMGPYVPLVDYIDPANLPQPANTQGSDLPSAGSCGQIAGPPLTNGATLSLTPPKKIVQWPTYWSSGQGSVPANTLVLNCPSGALGTPPSPTIFYATTQLASEAYGTCSPPGNPCTSAVYAQSSQPVVGQPPVPLAIVGTGFGYLPNSILPLALASCASPSSCTNLIEVHNDGNNGQNHAPWDTSNGAQCQMYLANWSDTVIWLVPNLPVGTVDMYGVSLSVVDDVSPLTFFPNTGNSVNCPVASGDELTFYVTNPQGGGTTNPGYSVGVQ